MIDLYTWPTPNGHKISIMLEELGADYRVHPVDIANGEQLAPGYAVINPNGRIPAIVDQDAPGGPLRVFESGAVLIYLASRFAAFLPSDPRGRWEAIEWLMLQVGEIGPMLGQAHHFRRFAPQPVPYAAERYTREAARLYGVLDRRLGEAEFLAAGAYTIADIATYPWIARHAWQGVSLADYPNVARWLAAVGRRPGVQKGLRVPEV